MSRGTWILPPVAVAAALLLFSPARALAAQAGTVVGMFGPCFIESGGTRSPLSLGQAVQVADTIDVTETGKLKLRMSDGSVVSIASGTRVTVAAYRVDEAGQRQEGQLSLASGLLRIVVAATRQPSRFEVETATGSAAVRATDWFITVEPNATEVAVLEGSVVLTGSTSARAVTVTAGAGSHVDAGHEPLPPYVEPPAVFTRLIARTNLEGLCQCIANRNRIQTSCVASAAACEAACASTQYAFIPSAPYSCGRETR